MRAFYIPEPDTEVRCSCALQKEPLLASRKGLLWLFKTGQTFLSFFIVEICCTNQAKYYCSMTEWGLQDGLLAVRTLIWYSLKERGFGLYENMGLKMSSCFLWASCFVILTSTLLHVLDLITKRSMRVHWTLVGCQVSHWGLGACPVLRIIILQVTEKTSFVCILVLFKDCVIRENSRSRLLIFPQKPTYWKNATSRKN